MPDPLPVAEGINKSYALERRLSATEAALRSQAFESARAFMRRAHANGGVGAGTSKSYPVPNDSSRRVDIEVWKGMAFV